MNESINIESLLNLSDGDRVFVKEILNLFIENTPVEVERIKTLIRSDNGEEISKVLHKLKSFTSPLGLTQLRSEISRLEKVVKSNELASLHAELADLILSLEELIVTTKHQFEELKSE